MGKPNDDLTPLASGSGSKETEGKDGKNVSRPFKKARYVWQIKGKSHLRDGNRRGRPQGIVRGKAMALSPVVQQCDEVLPESDILESSEEMEVVKGSDGEGASPGLAQGVPQAPADVSRCVRNFLHSLNHSAHSLRRWQTKHLAKGIIDNAINKVLEEMGFVPFPATAASNPHTGEEEGELQQNVENEAVSAAIENHGLHRRRCQHHHHHHFFQSSSSSDSDSDDSDDSDDDTSTESTGTPEPPESPLSAAVPVVTKQGRSKLILPCRCFPNKNRVRRHHNRRLDLDSIPPAMFIDPAEFMRTRLMVGGRRKRQRSTSEESDDSGCNSDVVVETTDGAIVRGEDATQRKKEEEEDSEYPDADPGEILDRALSSAIESKGLVILG